MVLSSFCVCQSLHNTGFDTVLFIETMTFCAQAKSPRCRRNAKSSPKLNLKPFVAFPRVDESSIQVGLARLIKTLPPLAVSDLMAFSIDATDQSSLVWKLRAPRFIRTQPSKARQPIRATRLTNFHCTTPVSRI
jgi:hypothetical protein